MKPFDSTSIPPDQMTPLVATLLRIIQTQADEIARLKEEITKLKGQKGRPKIKPSVLEKPKRTRDQTQSRSLKMQKVGKKEKKREERIIEPAKVPAGARFKGYKTYVVQDIVVQPIEIVFKMKVYTTPDGKTIRGELPKDYSTGHFGPELMAHCLQLYHGGFMTEPVLLEYLHEQGIKMSAGQLHQILMEKVEEFSEEIEAACDTGKKLSEYLNVDDTGARHAGVNGVCTCLSSPLFCCFQSSKSKSRLNFLKVLRGGAHKDYLLDEGALLYAFEHGLSVSTLNKMDDFLDEAQEKKFTCEKQWKRFLWNQGIVKEEDIRILSEGAVLSSAIYHGLPEEIPIVSDAAPQFVIWASHALCWVHEERHYRKFTPLSELEREELERIRHQIWDLYKELKSYSKRPSEKASKRLQKKFEKVFNRSGVSDGLDALLKNSYSRKAGLLQVLDYPWIPLHNNDCERDIRQYVKRRKISGTTRSGTGRKARDVFLSLKKTCQKLGVSFFGYLRDRIYKLNAIPALSDLVAAKAREDPESPTTDASDQFYDFKKFVDGRRAVSAARMSSTLKPAISF